MIDELWKFAMKNGYGDAISSGDVLKLLRVSCFVCHYTPTCKVINLRNGEGFTLKEITE